MKRRFSREAFNAKTIMEPFRVKTVQHIKTTTFAQREAALSKAYYNVFLLDGEDVMIDLLTDSGTGALSDKQWGMMMRGDETYAGSPSFYRFRDAVHKITGMPYILPTHQGRAAERLLFKSWPLDNTHIVPNNSHFDTTRANCEDRGAQALDLVISEAYDTTSKHPFKGNMDLDRLEECLRNNTDNIPMVMATVTNNSGGGQPVSMENLEGISSLAKKYGKPFILDCCRFAENAWFIKTRESGYENWTPIEIAQKMFSLSDGCSMSAKKDGMANMGGFLALRDEELTSRCKVNLILSEGFPTYGGLAGYDLEAVAVGLFEVLEPSYLEYRIRSVEYVAERATDIGYNTIAGGHALYLDAKALLPDVSYPAWALVNELYLVSGIRGVEIGSVMFGLQPDGRGGFTEESAKTELVRLAFPRRMYTQSHMDYLVEALNHVYEHRQNIESYKIISKPVPLRHFTAHFERVREEN